MRQYSKLNFYSLNCFLILPWLALIFLEISIKEIFIFSALFIPFLIYWDCIWYRIEKEGEIVIATFVENIKNNGKAFKVMAKTIHNNKEIYLEFWTPWRPNIPPWDSNKVPEYKLKVCFKDPMLCILLDQTNKY